MFHQEVKDIFREVYPEEHKSLAAQQYDKGKAGRTLTLFNKNTLPVMYYTTDNMARIAYHIQLIIYHMSST